MLFILLYLILEIIDGNGLNFFDEKRHWMDAWCVLNIVILALESISSICFTVNLDLKNKSCTLT